MHFLILIEFFRCYCAGLLLRALEVCFTNLGALRNNPRDESLNTNATSDIGSVAGLLLRALEVCFTNLGALRNNPRDERLNTNITQQFTWGYSLFTVPGGDTGSSCVATRWTFLPGPANG